MTALVCDIGMLSVCAFVLLVSHHIVDGGVVK